MTRRRTEQFSRAEAALRAFVDAPAAQTPVGPDALTEHVLSHFRGVASEVSAYARFLADRSVSVEAVRSLDDFARVPVTTKDNYQRVFPLPALCRTGALDRCDMLAMSSGSTGTPTAWPRFVTDELSTAARFEQVLVDAFRCDERRTLAVVCFALGTWVGGMYTTACCRHLATKGYPLTVVTPGNQKAEILRVVALLRDHYDQVVLFGYPPFLKDVVDSGRAEGYDWAATPVRLVMAGEVFSEEWRGLVCERIGSHDPAADTASLYGTADGGVLANETPLSVTIRRFLSRNPDAAKELFGEARLPTLCQYDPFHRYFEVESAQLVFSGDSGAPLVRYGILDRGGLVAFDAMLEFLARHGYDPLSVLGKGARVREQPFVYVFGRTNFAVSFYGANVFPENVSVGLEQPEVASHVTGKFVLEVTHGGDLDASLSITVELAAGAVATDALRAEVARSVRHHVERLNGEFANYTPPERRTPEIRLLPLGDPNYFPAGVKHRYTR